MSAAVTAPFPEGFLWGCATSAYQIEGSPLADGAGASIWHRFTHTPGKVANGETGDIACDHYRHFRDDVAMMREIGLQAYRFSISWGRVMPSGTGDVNDKGVGFYEQLVDALLEAGIQPMITLYHWDLPQALDDRGGWLNPEISRWFGDYAELLFRRFDDRVKYWITLNEPWVVVDNGYLHGLHAPGHSSLYEAALASNNLLAAHCEAVRRYRAFGSHQIGLAVNLEPKYPASNSAEDLHATRLADAWMNRQFLDPVLLGRHPDELDELIRREVPWYRPDAGGCFDDALDFLGVNYYTRAVTRHETSAWPVPAATVRQPQSVYTETGWEVCSQALCRLLNWIRDRYGNHPVYITENGCAFYDPPVARNGRVRDPLRQDYLCSHLHAVHRAIEAGCDIRGYFVWSLMDNFEWTQGCAKRFGLVHVDFETLRRTPKDSARLYAQIIASRGANLWTTEVKE